MVKNLHKAYRPGRPQCLGLSRSGGSKDAGDVKKIAVDDSSFEVAAGEIFGLLGPNGAGKSTTLNAIIAETQPTSGQVSVISLFFTLYAWILVQLSSVTDSGGARVFAAANVCVAAASPCLLYTSPSPRD